MVFYFSQVRWIERFVIFQAGNLNRIQFLGSRIVDQPHRFPFESAQ